MVQVTQRMTFTQALHHIDEYTDLLIAQLVKAGLGYEEISTVVLEDPVRNKLIEAAWEIEANRVNTLLTFYQFSV